MSKKPIFCATHPRACSTAFERVFMTREDLACIHEPFGDAFYYGPERLAERFENDSQARANSGFAESSYKTIFDRIEEEGQDGKRIFIKDIIHYLLPPNAQPAQIAPSLGGKKRGIGTKMTNGTSNTNGVKHVQPPFPFGTDSEPGNPTVVPRELLEKFHFTFLIRDPHYSIPSYYRCTIPPLVKMTGFAEFQPCEAGYDETRRMFDYLVAAGQIGPDFAGRADNESTVATNGSSAGVDICVVDADDLLDQPAEIIEAYCNAVGLDYHPGMLQWGDEKSQARAKEAFEKWTGFHEDAIDSKELRARTVKKHRKTEDEFDNEWVQKYGLKGANIIRQTVDECMPIYQYLKQFAIKV